MACISGRTRRWSSAGWVLPLALLALPNCSVDTFGTGTSPKLDPGPLPESSAIFCDIEKERFCATSTDDGDRIRLNEAALALTSGKSYNQGVDYSRTSACGGNPEVVSFAGPFPRGLMVCLNCSQIPTKYATPTEACVAKCRDAVRDDVGYCTAHARVSTNAENPFCFAGACFADGNPDNSFDDPRKRAEPVLWQNLTHVALNGDNLERRFPTDNTFDAGAQSPTQTITHGDGYVQFRATEKTTARLCGLSSNRTDLDPDYRRINFAIDLFADGYFYVFENGNKVSGPVNVDTATLHVDGAWGKYEAGDVFRVSVTDQLNGSGTFPFRMGGTAIVKYWHFDVGVCNEESECPRTGAFLQHSVNVAYPFRIDTSFREDLGTLGHVRVVRMR